MYATSEKAIDGQFEMVYTMKGPVAAKILLKIVKRFYTEYIAFCELQPSKQAEGHPHGMIPGTHPGITVIHPIFKGGSVGYLEKSIAGVFHNRAEQYQYEPFVRYKEEGRYIPLSWKKMQDMVTRTGLGLISLGMNKDDKAAVFSDNCWQWIVSDLAVLSIGAADVPIHATSSGFEAAYIINDSGAKVIFVPDRDYLDKILKIKNRLTSLEHIITFDVIKDAPEGVISLDDLMQQGETVKDKSVIEQRLNGIMPEDLATLFYTSGTTGLPKGVMLTHGNFLANVMQCFASHPMIDHHDESLAILPFSHALGRTVSLYLMIHVGAVINLTENFSTALQDLQEIRPTLAVGVPRLFEKIHASIKMRSEMDTPWKKKLFDWSASVAERAVDYLVQHKSMPATLHVQYDIADRIVFSSLRNDFGLDRIRVFISGGGSLAPDIDRFFNGIRVPVHNGYGLMETTTVTHVNRFDVFEFGSVGPALPDTLIKTAEDGEILIKGPQVMSGYYRRPEDTRAAFTQDGWLMTGDVGKIDNRGCLYITDRKRDIIITSGGKNIAPQNIENTLASDIFIEQALVIGEGMKYLTALIVPNFNELDSYAKNQGISFDSNDDLIKKPEILAFYDAKINQLMRDYSRGEQIRRITVLPHEFSIETGELTPTLKAKRKVINEKYAAEIEAMYREE
jgi:long-chain acyl-CoA synthetase